MHDNAQEPTYGIGAVARLTGIRLESLRAWERRYRLVTPRRSASNQRIYTREDIVRLQLIRQLVDRGHAVGSVATLSEQALRDRLQLHRGTVSAPLPDERPLPAMVYGDTLPFLVERWRGQLPLEVLAAYGRLSDLEADANRRQPAVVILELPALNPDLAGRLGDLRRQSGARRVVVVYSFGTQSILERLRREGVLMLRAPVTAPELAQACRIDAEHAKVLRPLSSEVLALTDETPPRRFDGEKLAAVAMAATRIRCECPHHLADLVLRINAFEAYSADCENRNERDAALHAQLYRTAGRARALLEEALQELINHEDIDLTASD